MNDITPTVAAIGQMHFEGNIIPHSWYKVITFPNGKADVNAILILAEIVYWYRPTVERDEATGEVVSVRKKFHADMLQRHYSAFAEQFGLSVRQCKDAAARLIKLGLLHRELRTVDTPQGKLGNVPFFEPVVDAIQRISSPVVTYKGSRSNVQALTPHGATYTKNKPKTSQRGNKRPPQGRKGSSAAKSPRGNPYTEIPDDEPRRKYSVDP